ncbi:pyridoxal phosphate-dependent aminotransferase [Planctomycetes bacterium Pla163]|uniref:pyridoxal phosphate-dependent aminotransferase n=1 Tax=Rohdeia mirabilis TaxID=2528008 RepID=UPI0011A89384
MQNAPKIDVRPDMNRNSRTQLRLDRNEGCAPPRAVLEALTALDVDDLRRYPDVAAQIGAVERAWAEHLDVDAERVVLTTGGDGAIDLFFACFGEPGARCVVATPTFEPIVLAAARAGMELVELDGFARRYPLADAAALLQRPQDRLVLVSPANPTGLALDGRTLRELCTLTAGRPTLIDLAYHEFAREDLAPIALCEAGACVLFSLSKAWGLAGLRVGCLVVPSELASTVRAARPVYPVATPSLAIARRALEDFADLPLENARRTAPMRERVERLLLRAGLEPLPSEANFVLARGAGAADLATGLAARRVFVRRFEGRAELADAVRVTCPASDAELARLVLAIDDLCREREAALDAVNATGGSR